MIDEVTFNQITVCECERESERERERKERVDCSRVVAVGFMQTTWGRGWGGRCSFTHVRERERETQKQTVPVSVDRRSSVRKSLGFLNIYLASAASCTTLTFTEPDIRKTEVKT